MKFRTLKSSNIEGAHFDPATGTRYVVLEANYGYSTGITRGGQLFLRSD